VRDLVAGSGIDFDDRGPHELKGLAEPRRLFPCSAPPSRIWRAGLRRAIPRIKPPATRTARSDACLAPRPSRFQPNRSAVRLKDASLCPTTTSRISTEARQSRRLDQPDALPVTRARPACRSSAKTRQRPTLSRFQEWASAVNRRWWGVSPWLARRRDRHGQGVPTSRSSRCEQQLACRCWDRFQCFAPTGLRNGRGRGRRFNVSRRGCAGRATFLRFAAWAAQGGLRFYVSRPCGCGPRQAVALVSSARVAR
jgi:hypothetical protein